MEDSSNNTTNDKEGKDLLGKPSFEKLQNGRFKCLETAHELPQHAIDSYSISKRCRFGLIDFYLANNKPPLNMFKQCPLNSSKLVCKLTGDTINKNEEHIWKHINGKRFFNKLEQLEAGVVPAKEDVEGTSVKKEKQGSKEKENNKEKMKKEKTKKKKKKKQKEEIVSEIRDVPTGSDTEENDFWMPPVGDRWDFDDGHDRWASDSESESGDLHSENDRADVENEEELNAASELSTRTKRMSIEVGPSNYASRKKKSKTNSP